MRIKIVATLGPASSNYKTMKAMVGNGVRIFRLNFSHANAASFTPLVADIRRLEAELGIPLTIMGDLCGPKDRIGEVVDSPLAIDMHQKVYLSLSELIDTVYGPCIPLTLPSLLQGLAVGMPVLLADGMLRFTVSKVIEPDRLFELTAANSGIITSYKGIAFPGKTHSMSALTDKDRIDLHEGLALGLDAIAISFVQCKEDILDLKAEMAKYGRYVPIIAKIERTSAVDNLASILLEVEVAMVARGDLGIEAKIADLPVIQKRIIRACRHAQKGCIVATQMLMSMVNNPGPTRAEVTDVANAILDGADCVMLSEETAVGNYPVEATAMIRSVAETAEAYLLERLNGPYVPKKEKNPAKYLAYAACLLADNLDAAGVVCHSISGFTARLLSSRRPAQPIYALSPDETVLRGLNYFFGVHPYKPDMTISNHTERVERFIQNSPYFASGQSAIITSGQTTKDQTMPFSCVTASFPIRTNLIKCYFKG